jgi:hypothetical protein
MGCKIGYFDPAERAREKQESRDRDAARLKAGQISAAELNRENDFFASLPIENSEIVAIGGRPFDVRARK